MNITLIWFTLNCLFYFIKYSSFKLQTGKGIVFLMNQMLLRQLPKTQLSHFGETKESAQLVLLVQIAQKC